MSLIDLLTIIGVPVTAYGLYLTIYYGRRGVVKRKIQWKAHVDPLFSPDNADWHKAITVQLLGRAVTNPYFVTLTLTNVGRDDISSVMFDANRPIVFTIGGKLASLPQPTTVSHAVTVQRELVRFGPDLLHRGDSWTARIVAEGRPTVHLSSQHMINVKIVEAPSKAQPVRIDVTTTIRLIALGFSLGLILGLYFSLG